jgi:hypothetical protein
MGFQSFEMMGGYGLQGLNAPAAQSSSSAERRSAAAPTVRALGVTMKEAAAGVKRTCEKFAATAVDTQQPT